MNPQNRTPCNGFGFYSSPHLPRVLFHSWTWRRRPHATHRVWSPVSLWKDQLLLPACCCNLSRNWSKQRTAAIPQQQRLLVWKDPRSRCTPWDRHSNIGNTCYVDIAGKKGMWYYVQLVSLHLKQYQISSQEAKIVYMKREFEENDKVYLGHNVASSFCLDNSLSLWLVQNIPRF